MTTLPKGSSIEIDLVRAALAPDYEVIEELGRGGMAWFIAPGKWASIASGHQGAARDPRHGRRGSWKRFQHIPHAGHWATNIGPHHRSAPRDRLTFSV